MCTRYITPEDREIEAAWYIGARSAERWLRSMRPLYTGVFIRRARDVTEYTRELVSGQWGLIPAFSPTREPASPPRPGETRVVKLSTWNARFTGIEKKNTFKDSWKHGRRCVILADSFDEPCWESGKNEWWRFKRADGRPWALAGLWSEWLDHSTGELVQSYAMLTVNANLHPLMSRMHKIEVDKKTKVPLPIQDKRSVVAIEEHDIDRWLTCTPEEAREMVGLIPVQFIDAGPAALDLEVVERAPEAEPAEEG